MAIGTPPAPSRSTPSASRRISLSLLVLAGPVLAAMTLARPAPAQEEPWNPEARRLAAFAPGSTPSLERSAIRTGMQRSGYPALEATFTGASGDIDLYVLFEPPEGGQGREMLRAATERDAAEPWALDDLEAWRITGAPRRAPGPEAEQRLIRVPGGGDAFDAWVLMSGPGSGDAFRELAEALDPGRLGELSDEFAGGGFRRARPADVTGWSRASNSAKGRTVSFEHPPEWVVTDISERFSHRSGPVVLVSRRVLEDPMFFIRPEPMTFDGNAVAVIAVDDPRGELEGRITSSDFNDNLFRDFETVERPHRADVEGRPGMTAFFRGPDAAGVVTVNRHVLFREDGAEVQVETFVAAGEWTEVAPMMEALIAGIGVR